MNGVGKIRSVKISLVYIILKKNDEVEHHYILPQTVGGLCTSAQTCSPCKHFNTTQTEGLLEDKSIGIEMCSDVW